MKLLLFKILMFCVLVGHAQEEQIIIFTQDSDQLFIEHTLPKLIDFANEEHIALYDFNLDQGIPENITSTPAIIYRNSTGQSIYANRYSSFSTIKNFIRSSRVAPQQNKPLKKGNIYVRSMGKMQVAAAIKITTINSKNDNQYTDTEQNSFIKSAQAGISKGLENYNFKNFETFEKTDRIFYLDFHPYFVNKDSLILSFKLYSQFSCIDPIYISFNDKIKSTDIETAFKNATIILNTKIEDSLINSAIGDAYTFVPDIVKTTSLLQIKIPIPQSKEIKRQAVDPNRPMPMQWAYDAPISKKIPVLQFNFKAPLSRYIGEVRNISGTIKLDDNFNLKEGAFQAIMKSLTMGETTFDKKVLKSYIRAKSNPRSEFITTSIIDASPLAWQETSSLSIRGKMTLLKKSRPISVAALLTPYLDESGKEKLLVQANWSMNISDNWGIEGPDGPKPAKEILEFSMNFLMQPIIN